MRFIDHKFMKFSTQLETISSISYPKQSKRKYVHDNKISSAVVHAVYLDGKTK